MSGLLVKYSSQVRNCKNGGGYKSPFHIDGKLDNRKSKLAVFWALHRYFSYTLLINNLFPHLDSDLSFSLKIPRFCSFEEWTAYRIHPASALSSATPQSALNFLNSIVP